MSGLTNIVLLDEGMSNRIFNLDLQTVVDAGIMALAVGIMFFILSYLLFNPVRDMLKKRQDKIEEDLKNAEDQKTEAIALKAEYDDKLKNVGKEVDEILSEGRKKALKRENEIIDEAKAEADKILERANKEIELEKSKVKDDVKQEIIAVAQCMAGKIITASIDEKTQEKLIDEALNEMGDKTWQN